MVYPVLKEKDTWFQNSAGIKRDSITAIQIADSYMPTGSTTASWDASAAQNGSIMVYVEGKKLTIAGNGSGKIKTSVNASWMFSDSNDKDCFVNVVSITGLQVLDVSDATTILRWFQKCKALVTVDVSDLDVSNVTDMAAVFSQASALTEIVGLDTWAKKVHRVTTMRAMFQLATNLKTLDLSGWETYALEEMQSLCAGHSSYSDMALESIDVTGWDVSKVISMQGAFQRCSMLKTITGIEGWEALSCYDYRSMFYKCAALTELNAPKLVALAEMPEDLPKNENEPDTDEYYIELLPSVAHMFEDCTSLVSVYSGEWNMRHIKSIRLICRGCQELERMDVTDWEFTCLETMEYAFYSGIDHEKGYMSLRHFDPSGWNVSTCKNLHGAFYGWVTRREGNKATRHLDLSKWDVSSVQTFNHAFSHSYLTIGDTSGWKNSCAVDHDCMFLTVQNEVIDVSGIDTSNSLKMEKMFKKCFNLKKIVGFSGIRSPRAICMMEYFSECESLEEIDLSNIDTRSAATEYIVDADGTKRTEYGVGDMFYHMHSLKKITVGKNFSFTGATGVDEQGRDLSTPRNQNVLPDPVQDARPSDGCGNRTYGVEGADGKWYDLSGTAYAPNALPSFEVRTYYASLPLARAQRVVVSNGTLMDIAGSVRELTGTAEKYVPSELPGVIVGALPDGDEVYY